MHATVPCTWQGLFMWQLSTKFEHLPYINLVWHDLKLHHGIYLYCGNWRTLQAEHNLFMKLPFVHIVSLTYHTLHTLTPTHHTIHTLTPTQSCWSIWYCLCWVHNIPSEERSIWAGGSFLLWPTGWYSQWWRYWSCVMKHLVTQCL